MQTTPNMGLTVWNLTTDLFDHTALAGTITAVDQHDHSKGKGVQITSTGLANGAVGPAQVTSGIVTITKGLLSGLPAPAQTGRRYYATEIGQELYDTGTSWIPIGSPSPIGAITSYAGTSDPIDADGTARWLICDGRAISRTTYSLLFARIGITHGTGDGSTTFNIPNAQERVLLGAGPQTGLVTRAVGETGGPGGSGATYLAEETHVLTVAQLAQHVHATTEFLHTHGFGNGTYTVPSVSDNWSTRQIAGGQEGLAPIAAPSAGFGFISLNVVQAATTGLTVNPTGSNAAHNNMQPYLVINHIIRVL